MNHRHPYEPSDAELRRQLATRHRQLQIRLDRIVEFYVIVLQAGPCDCFEATPPDRCECNQDGGLPAAPLCPTPAPC